MKRVIASVTLFVSLAVTLFTVHLYSDRHDMLNIPTIGPHSMNRTQGTNITMRADDEECPSTPEMRALYAAIDAQLPLATTGSALYAEQKTERNHVMGVPLE